MKWQYSRESATDSLIFEYYRPSNEPHISAMFNTMCLQLNKSVSVWPVCFFPKVVDIMRVNVDKVLERDQKLSELDDRADALQAGASQFETSAAKLKNKYWWKNAKVSATERARCALRTDHTDLVYAQSSG